MRYLTEEDIEWQERLSQIKKEEKAKNRSKLQKMINESYDETAVLKKIIEADKTQMPQEVKEAIKVELDLNGRSILSILSKMDDASKYKSKFDYVCKEIFGDFDYFDILNELSRDNPLDDLRDSKDLKDTCNDLIYLDRLLFSNIDYKKESVGLSSYMYAHNNEVRNEILDIAHNNGDLITYANLNSFDFAEERYGRLKADKFVPLIKCLDMLFEVVFATDKEKYLLDNKEKFLALKKLSVDYIEGKRGQTATTYNQRNVLQAVKNYMR